jgi:hypothetical protein
MTLGRFIRNPGGKESRSMALEFEDLTEKIIGAAIEVHRHIRFLNSWLPYFMVS